MFLNGRLAIDVNKIVVGYRVTRNYFIAMRSILFYFIKHLMGPEKNYHEIVQEDIKPT